MPDYFELIGKLSINEIGLRGLFLHKKSGQTITWGVSTSACISEEKPENIRANVGCVLISEKWGSLKLLGIDYSDFYPRVVFLAENAMSFWYRDPKQTVIDHSQLSVSVKIKSINGYPCSGVAGFSFQREGIQPDFAYLGGFDTISTITGEKRLARIGRIDEITIEVYVSGYGKDGRVEETHEITARLDEEHVVIIGDPYGWWEDQENYFYSELSDEWKEYYAQQRGE